MENPVLCRARRGYVQREIGETGHTPVREPAWHENVLGIDTGVHIEARGYGQLTIARIDGKRIETASFAR